MRNERKYDFFACKQDSQSKKNVSNEINFALVTELYPKLPNKGHTRLKQNTIGATAFQFMQTPVVF